VLVPENLQDYLDVREREILCKVLRDTRFNRTAAATKLGLSLRQIRYRIARLNIAMPDGDTAENSDDSDSALPADDRS
jgi:two-component system response regulator PilR (NtrC family)